MKRTESTNDRIVRLYQEGSTAERIADEVAMSVGAVNNVLERRIPGYAEFLAKKSLAMNKAKAAAKEEAAKAEAEAQRLEAEKKLENAEAAGGMLVENYKQSINAPEAEPVSILTGEAHESNILTEEFDQPTEEKDKTVVESEPEVVEGESTSAEDETADLEELLKLAKEAEAAEEIPVEKLRAEDVNEYAAAEAAVEEREEKEMTSYENIESADPAAKAAQKIALFAKAQIEENDAKIAKLTAQIAELNEAITALKIENEQYRAVIK